MAFKRQIAVRCIVGHGAFGHLDGYGWRSQVGIQVFQPQHLGVVERIGSIANIIDPDPAKLLQARNTHARFPPPSSPPPSPSIVPHLVDPPTVARARDPADA
ncbi:hypothetical protein MOKP106_46250 [Mycobacterium avium subsp. hominissuis]|nr:hypothetical protein I549_2489 [Mycobacterium avium subsp. avium 2285 (R)]